MAEAAGLAIGVIGVTALFSTVVETFDIVLSARECTKEYKQLSALVGLQRLRFQVWGEGVGLPSGRPTKEPKIPYNTQLDLPHVEPCIKFALEEIRQLLDSVTEIDGRYGAEAISDQSEDTTVLSGMGIFHKSFDRLRRRIRKGQKNKSIRKATRWALHDAAEFEKVVKRLTDFVDNLFKVTKELGLLQERYEVLRLHTEINAITNIDDLESLAEATSRHSATSLHGTVSDAASRRLSAVFTSRPHSNASTYSIYTAKTRPSQRDLEAVEEEDSEEDDPDEDLPNSTISAEDSAPTSLLSARSCAECDEASLQCIVSEDATSCINCLEDGKECSFDLSGSSTLPGVGTTISSRSTPQHERLMAESVARAGLHTPPRMLTFQAGDAHHGEAMKEIDDNNLDYWVRNVAEFHSQAHKSSSSVAKRMFYELKTIRKAKVPFISATPVCDDLSKILASIEGPPETPYEGGIFWIMVLVPHNTPRGIPILRFHTKIYHPNIDHRTGILCADFQQKWNSAKVSESVNRHFAESAALWSERTSPDMLSLLSLLIAICGLLASPNVQDPLIPEIALKLVQDPECYQEIAKKWTSEYAKASEKPDEASLLFPDETSEALDAAISSEAILSEPENDLEFSSSAMQAYLRAKYDDKFNNDWITSSNPSGPPSVFSQTSGSLTTPPSGQFKDGRHTEPIIDAILVRDAEQGHLRQMTHEKLSKIEQWRMVRELRLALEKRLRQSIPGMWQEDATSKFWTTDSRIRTLIAAALIRLNQPTAPEGLRQYLNVLMKSFGFANTLRALPAKHPAPLDPIAGLHTVEPVSEPASLLNRAKDEVSLPIEITESSGQTPPADASSNTYIMDRHSSSDFGTADNSISLPLISRESADSPVPNARSDGLDQTIDEFHSSSGSSVTDKNLEQTSDAPIAPTTHTKSSQKQSLIAQYTPNQQIPYYTSSANPFRMRSPYGGPYYASYSKPPISQTRYQSPYGYFRDNMWESSQAFSPRYTSSGHYASNNTHHTRSSLNGRSSGGPKQRSYYSYRQPPIDSDDEYVMYGGTVYVDHRHRNGSPPSRRSPARLQRPQTAKPSTAPKKPMPTPKATEVDARRHRIPPGYSLRNWDPSEEPIMLLGSVFDANSLGKWIYDWTVYHHGPATPIADMAGELWLLMIQLAGKITRAEECLPRIRLKDNREMVEDFIESGERLTDKLKKLLKACETPMLRAGKKRSDGQLGKNAGTEFIDSIFGRDRQLEQTEKFMASIRLWDLRFDANCEDILRNHRQAGDSKATLAEIVMTPVGIRTAFGLEDIAEEPETKSLADGIALAGEKKLPAFKRTEIESRSELKDQNPGASKAQTQSMVASSQPASRASIAKDSKKDRLLLSHDLAHRALGEIDSDGTHLTVEEARQRDIAIVATSFSRPAGMPPSTGPTSVSYTSPEDEWFSFAPTKKSKKSRKKKNSSDETLLVKETHLEQQPNPETSVYDPVSPKEAKDEPISNAKELPKDNDPISAVDDSWMD